MKRFLILLTVLVFTLPACKKDKSPTELLTGNDWRIKSWTVSPALLGVTDLYATYYDDCDKDDFTSFESNGVAIFDEGATKCNAADPQTTTGAWSLNDAETEFTLTEDGVTDTWTIKELTESTFKLENTFQEDILGTGTLTTYTYVLTLESI